MLGREGLQLIHPAAHQGGGHAVAEAERAQLLVPGAQGRRPVDHPHATAFGQIEQVGGIEIGLVHRRILTHPHGLEVVERQQGGLAEAVPGLGHLPAGCGAADRGEAHRLGAGPGAMATATSRSGDSGVSPLRRRRIGDRREISGRAHPGLQTRPFRRLDQGHAGILGRVEASDRIDHEEMALPDHGGAAHASMPRNWLSQPVRSSSIRSSQPPMARLLMKI